MCARVSQEEQTSEDTGQLIKVVGAGLFEIVRSRRLFSAPTPSCEADVPPPCEVTMPRRSPAEAANDPQSPAAEESAEDSDPEVPEDEPVAKSS